VGVVGVNTKQTEVDREIVKVVGQDAADNEEVVIVEMVEMVVTVIEMEW
jgi:hypothetical protein